LNTVSGIQNMNKTLEGLGEVIAAGQFSQAIGLLDKKVLLQGNDLSYKGEAVEGQFKAVDQTSDVKVQIRNGIGQVVREIPVGNVDRGMHSYTWDGRNSDGTKLPAGNYTASVSGSVLGEEVALNSLYFDQIDSVDNNGSQGFSISTAGGRTVSLADVVRVY
ncbi:MAG: FlgD immunoglobulin-like domain containing protein, partial [Limnobacter sp.]|nr:FlgD immunoglobulin-like domain containing protein [Limnobacter sp.]